MTRLSIPAFLIGLVAGLVLNEFRRQTPNKGLLRWKEYLLRTAEEWEHSSKDDPRYHENMIKAGAFRYSACMLTEHINKNRPGYRLIALVNRILERKELHLVIMIQKIRPPRLLGTDSILVRKFRKPRPGHSASPQM